MSEEFKILSAREHVRTRPGMYLGSTAIENVDRFVLGQWKSVQYVPAISKMIDEIIDNAIDEAIRTNYAHANEISVVIKANNFITITDNGRGIPQDIIKDSDGNEVSRPVAAWSKTNAGTSFDDERMTIGANGVGSACTNFMSHTFIGKTWRDENQIEFVSCGGSLKTSTSNSKVKKGSSGTSVTFQPDFKLFGINDLSEVATEELVLDRLTSLQIAFSDIRFKFNGNRIKENNLKKYSWLFSEDSVVTSSQNLKYFITSSDDGHRATSYINGVNTRLGGSYNTFIMNGISEELIPLIKKKYKIDISKNIIMNSTSLVLFSKGFKNPSYDSQTKERLTSPVSAVKKHYEECEVHQFDKIAKSIMACENIINPIIEAQLAKRLAAEARAAKLAKRKNKKLKVPKHIAASTRDATLFLCEGDSAIGFLLNVRDPKRAGGYPLRGVVMNTWDMKPHEVLQNKELSELISVLNLDLTDPDSVDDMAYTKIATLCDADVDGNHIAALLLAFFYKYWPRLYSENRISMTKTPILISSKGKDVKWFYSVNDGQVWKDDEKSKGYYHRYIKGLASLTEEEYDSIINKPFFLDINIDIPEWFEVMMGSSALPRKEWLTGNVPELIKAVQVEQFIV